MPKSAILKFLNVCILYLLFLPVPVAADDIREFLSATDWTAVDTQSAVRFQPDKWNGPEDLSFSYNIQIKNGQIYLGVKVTDDHVFLKDGTTILSDHVEVWLTDPRLINFSRQSIEFLTSDFTTDESWLERAEATAQKYQEKQFSTQLIFNTQTVFGAERHSTYSLPHIVEYEYIQTDTGYEFYAKIPINKTLALRTPNLQEIAFLVDVVDIDEPQAQRQKLLMSSSLKRKFGDPSTFHRYAFSSPHKVKLPLQLEIFAKLRPRGFLEVERRQNAYQYMVEGAITGDCFDFMNFPDYYHVFTPDIAYIDPETGISVIVSDEEMAFARDGVFTIVQNPLNNEFSILLQLLYLKESEQGVYVVLHHLQLYGSPCSRGPCAGAAFDSLLWLHLDRNFELLDYEQFGLEDSCGWESDGIPGLAEENRFKQRPFETTSGMWLHISQYDSYTLLFTESFPENGLLETFIGEIK